MRYTALVALLLTLGGIAVTAAAPVEGQEKEPEPKSKDRKLRAPFDEWVTFRRRAVGEKFEFNAPVKAMAYRKEKDGATKFYLEPRASSDQAPPVGSEIIDAKDVIWVVTKSTVSDPYICQVVQKPAPAKKKPKG